MPQKVEVYMGKKKKMDLGKMVLQMENERLLLAYRYSKDCLREIMSRYSALVKMTAELEIESSFDENGVFIKRIPTQVWPFVEGVKFDESLYVQGEMRERIAIIENRSRANGLERAMFANIDFKDRTHEHESETAMDSDTFILSHSVGWFKFSGDETVHWFESPENESIDARVVTGDSGYAENRAYLLVRAKQEENVSTHDATFNKVVCELDEFCMLSML
jgi:hypothetical protein